MATGGTTYIDAFYPAPDGLKLHARIYGTPREGTLPVVCLPGLTRNARDFHELALILSAGRQVIAFDYRGRGQSDYDPDWRNYQVGIEAADIVAGLASLGLDRAAFIGTSRGGLIMHVLAVIKPALLAAAVLNDVGPVLEMEGLIHIRAYLEQAAQPRDYAEAVAVQRSIHGAAFTALRDADWEHMVDSIYRRMNGEFVPDFDPKLVNVLGNFDPRKPLPELWPQFEKLAGVPLLAIRGSNSKLLSSETLAAMARRHPDCRTVTVEGQGHAPFLETGDVPSVIQEFIAAAEQ
ncbi:alpha/beta hydrolase [Mesorhizobium sp. BAC0120]|uniref:alpha/beta fold hydrolase n=1 Tax=Mesorhizobium sp. BAC0120 TaxID=3090670 RepID=UPI00298CFC26|nr:alpha/beta hydrolase [Mesorhizobium sp. BAC0120]MDW6021190.1 alpha/beta hydrolase [Mesorhizobium sp. BAC0120]